jgi:guanylate kinase
MKPGLLIVVSGPAGVGKGSIMKRVREISSDVILSVSATTRKPRPGEVDGINYFFKTREQFEEMISQNSLIEWVEYCGNYYGTPKDFVCSELAKGHNVILEIDVEGSLNIRELFPDAVLCFILPPTYAELEKRLRDRKTEDETTIARRLSRAREEFEYISRYDYIVLNDTIEEASQEFLCIVQAEKMRTARNRELINSFRNI